MSCQCICMCVQLFVTLDAWLVNMSKGGRINMIHCADNIDKTMLDGKPKPNGL